VSLAWYRFRATFRRRWTGYLSVVLLVGLVGGVAMGAIAGARRTQSAFPAYLAATDASQLTMQASSNASQFTAEQIEKLGQQLEHLPHVTRLAVAPNLFVVPLGPHGRPLPSAVNNDDVTAIGSEHGEYFTQDRVTVAQGRMADPKSPSEMVATAEAARLGGWHVGETVLFGAYTLQQAESPDFNFATEQPALRFSAKLVGLVVFPSQVVNDDVDRYPTFVLLTPALTERLRATQVYPSFGLRLAHGSADVPVVEKEIIGLLPRGTTYTFHVTSVAEGEVGRSSKPEAIALGVFGSIAGLAALLIAGLAIGRGISEQGDELDALRALGADPLMLTWDLMLGVLGAIVLGALVAVGVAVGLSPLAPIGPAHQIDPSPGFAADWTVLATGLVVLIVGLGVLTAILAYRASARRRPDQRSERIESGSRVVNAAARSGLPPSGVAGLRFALEPGRGRTSVPVRSALVGAVLAVVVVVTTLTFASGLNALDSHPALYGWNWNYAINAAGGSGSVPPVVAQLLPRDPDVAAFTGYNFAGVQIDGQTIPVLLAQKHAELNPPILSGHALEADNEIVLGAATLATLHKKVGDTVTVSYGSPSDAPVYVPPTRLRVVGTATLPAIGTSGALHPSMGTGAMISEGIESPAFKKAITQSDPNLNGQDVEVVRFRRGVTAAAGLASLHKITTAADKVMAADPQGQGDVYDVLGVQRPAEIVNYQSTGATPGILATGLAVGAVVALGLTLATSVRRRRRDFALLKTLGFTRYQLALTVAWQASVAAVVGIVIGVPLGIALGSWLWDLFARGIYAVPEASVPIVEVVAVALAALVLANLVAAIPGGMAARTRAALVLRAE
jgi:FtsX-like permease family